MKYFALVVEKKSEFAASKEKSIEKVIGFFPDQENAEKAYEKHKLNEIKDFELTNEEILDEFISHRVIECSEKNDYISLGMLKGRDWEIKVHKSNFSKLVVKKNRAFYNCDAEIN